jgi:hypothetical protein
MRKKLYFYFYSKYYFFIFHFFIWLTVTLLFLLFFEKFLQSVPKRKSLFLKNFQIFFSKSPKIEIVFNPDWKISISFDFCLKSSWNLKEPKCTKKPSQKANNYLSHLLPSALSSVTFQRREIQKLPSFCTFGKMRLL